jgi:hypothetical protein
MRQRGRLALVSLIFVCVGCASTVNVEVKGTQKTASGIPARATYVVLPAEEVQKDSGFQKYGDLVAQQMDKRGYRRADAKTAQLGVFLDYLMTDTTAPSRGALNTQEMAGMGSAKAGTGAFGATGTSSGLPDLHRFSTQVVIVVADLVKSSESKELVELWSGESRTTGRKPDLPGVLPFMIEAAFRTFGQTTATVRYNFEKPVPAP